MASAPTATNESSLRDILARPFQTSPIGPVWLGIGVTLGYLILRGAFDGLWLLFSDFPPGHQPLWRNDLWWTDFINAALVGYLPAAQEIMRRGVARDLRELRPLLRVSEAELASLRESMTGPASPTARLVAALGVPFGVALAFVDPAISGGAAHSASDPVFVTSILRTALFGWLVLRFGVYDFNLTRAYTRLCRERVAVDLLDVRALAAFARRGQNSALSWVLFSTLFSLFWLGGAAAGGNLLLLLMVLSMATLAFGLPLVALRRNILTVKHAELDRLRERIRERRAAALGAEPPASGDSPALANTIAYYQLIDSTPEWPVDAANLLKFIGYLALGLGSWLGGAVVEKLLEGALAS